MKTKSELLVELKIAEREARRARSSDGVWSDDDSVAKAAGVRIQMAKTKVIALKKELRTRFSQVGQYSGLTRQELAQNALCETDFH